MSKPHVSISSGNYHWVTPHHIIKAVTATMGGIDLDPASNSLANMVVKAKRIITEPENALDPDTNWQSKDGRVWINPPYKQPDIFLFAKRLLEEICKNNVKQAIWISNNATETRYGQLLLSTARVICFTRGRIKFLNCETLLPHNTPLQGQMIMGFGEVDVREFKQNFCDMGICQEIY